VAEIFSDDWAKWWKW